MRSKIEPKGNRAVVTIEENSLPNIAVLTADYKGFMQQVREYAMAGDYGRYHQISKPEDAMGFIFTRYTIAHGWDAVKDRDTTLTEVRRHLIDDHAESISLTDGSTKYEFQQPPLIK